MFPVTAYVFPFVLSFFISLSTAQFPDPEVVNTPYNYTTVTYADPRVNQTFEITFTVDSKGHVIENDDEVWGQLAVLESWIVEEPAPGPLKRSFAVLPDYGWPDATVVYKFDSCATRETLKDIVHEATSIWKGLAPYLNFMELPPGNQPAERVTIISMDDEDRKSCHSSVALSDVTEQLTMNLQWVSRRGNTGCGQRLRHVLHEFGHLLGLKHEHQRPDRESYLRYNCENFRLLPEACPADDRDCCPTDCCDDAVRRNRCCQGVGNFRTLPLGNLYMLTGEYDFDSIMQYPSDAYANEDSETLTRLDGRSIPDYMTPSVGDVQAVCKIYQAECDRWASCMPSFPDPVPESCGTCDPTSGKNKCHITTSCISTGAEHHCACRAGYKADADSGDITKHFRLPWANFEHLVFVPENTPCDTLCTRGSLPDLCTDVELHSECAL